jgi:tRNA dimethylallyltransferase
LAAVRLRVICGPTAAGKSGIALDLAARYGAAIVSADSRQVYKGFDIGTAKPAASERERVPHYGVDVVQPDGRYSAAAWANDAEGWIADARAKQRVPLVVGGTGLYIKALVEPLFTAPELDPARRAALAESLGRHSLADLRRWCEQLDPARAHLGRTQLVRAVETVLLSGQRISDLHASQRHDPGFRTPDTEASYLLVDPGATLAERIVTRVDQMLARGWRMETERLANTVPGDAPAWKASGYRVIRSLAEGEISLSTARELVIIETRQYAKRQRTWFRHQLPSAAVTHVNPDDPALRDVVREWWERAE